MSKQGRKHQRKGGRMAPAAKASKPAPPSRKVKRIYAGLIVTGCVVVGALAVALPLSGGKKPVNTRAAETATPAPRTLAELLALPESELGKVDFALMNLLCAEGLPGSEHLDIQACLATLNKWAEYSTPETIRLLYKFKKAPQEYENSEGYFRMLVLNTILQQDCKVHYNRERIRDVNFRNSKDLFIHGMIDDGNGGTCASMPVLLVAVARRMGYPVKLVSTKGHLFCRWEMPGDRINLESSGVGLNTYKDDYYKTWPMNISDEEVKREGFLVSMSPRDELGCFMAERGDCLEGNGRLKEAEEAYAAAFRFSPGADHYRRFMLDARRRQRPEGESRRIAVGPGWSPDLPPAIETLEFNRMARARSEEFSKRVPSGNPIPDPAPYSSARPQPGALNPSNSGSSGNRINPVMTPDMWGHLPKAAH